MSHLKLFDSRVPHPSARQSRQRLFLRGRQMRHDQLVHGPPVQGEQQNLLELRDGLGLLAVHHRQLENPVRGLPLVRGPPLGDLLIGRRPQAPAQEPQPAVGRQLPAIPSMIVLIRSMILVEFVIIMVIPSTSSLNRHLWGTECIGGWPAS